MRWGVTGATIATVTLMAGLACAQRLDVGWGVGIGSGVEAGEVDKAQSFRRARTRVVVPVDVRVDEDPHQGVGFVAFAEVEPRASLGCELRYMRWLAPPVVGFLGAAAVIAPRTLLGANVGIRFHIPLGGRSSIFLEPSVAAMPFGADLPDSRLLLWGLLSLGYHGHS